ncbi:hypothetical protein [Lysobacter sp. M15]|uniref:hypothetical protein n=1 Tax=Lysobacter sp. M15 TaxID=2916837 RepID=UPI001F582784|nr:hypothetical protein [Lysobacter sp. M15]
MRLGWSGWSMDVPEIWTVTDDPECLTLELTEHGALQASSATKSSGAVSAEELYEFADGQEEDWGTPVPVTYGDFQGLVCAYEQGGFIWRRWFLSNGSTIVFVTYNGIPQVAQHELTAAETILSSLRVEREA